MTVRTAAAPRRPRRTVVDEPPGLVGALQVIMARLIVAAAARVLDGAGR